MRISDVKATLLELFSGKRRFSKIKAALPTNVASGISGPEIENQLESYPTYETIKQYRIARLEARAHIDALSPRHNRRTK